MEAHASSKPTNMDIDAVSRDNLKTLFENQRGLSTIGSSSLAALVQAFEKYSVRLVRGSIFFTGVGKSGFIAQKLTQILVSTGTKAIYLNPTDALHGDIGIVGGKDLMLAFSKSGSTEELLKLIPYAKAKGAQVVSVTCLPGSQMEKVADHAVVLPLERELCPFNLAPVTSTAIQMIFGDTIAIALMQAKRLTKDQYAMNHPAGRIGKRLMLCVHAVMVTGDQVPTVSPDTSILKTLGVLSSKGCGCVLVTDELKVEGIFTDGDVRRTVQTEGVNALTRTVGECMTKSPKSIRSDAKAVDALRIMEDPTRKIQHLPVVDDGKLQGLVTLHHLVSAGI